MRIQINGEPREVADEITLAQLVSLLQLKPEQIAIELNRTVVRRTDWSSALLREGDTLEIVYFVGGGNHPQDYADGQETAKLSLLRTRKARHCVRN